MGGASQALRLRGLSARDSSGRCLVDGVDLDVSPGEIVGLVGESGSGKTITLRCCMGLAPRGVSWAAEEDAVAGESLLGASRRKRARLLGTRVGFVPQNTMEYLHPLIRVRDQVVDGLLAHRRDVTRAQAVARARALLDELGIEESDRVLASYPAQLSGGMRQRVKLAAALICDPAIVVADEPTAALDVVTQGRVVDMLVRACRERGVAVLMVSHAIGLVRGSCDRVAVMHAGRVVERGAARRVCDDPGHPYTRALVAAQPRVGAARDRRLAEIPGTMPAEGRDAAGCTYAGRCPLAGRDCVAGPISARTRDRDHEVRCLHAWAAPGGGRASGDPAGGEATRGGGEA